MFRKKCKKKFKNSDFDAKRLNKLYGEPPKNSFESNGCTWSPDYLGGADLRPACHYHDWAYVTLDLGTEAEREQADRNLYSNLILLGVSKTIANVYFKRVRLWGMFYFKYSKGNKPFRPRLFIKTIFTRNMKW